MVFILQKLLQDIGARYPAWLEENRATLSEADIARYEEQQRHIKDICRLYDEDPDNFTELVNALQQVGAASAHGVSAFCT